MYYIILFVLYLFVGISFFIFLILLVDIFLSVLRFVPFVPSKKEKIPIILKLADPKPGEKMVDLGSGDGRLVIAFAEQGIESHGYEINLFLVLYSRWQIYRKHLQDKAFIHWNNFNKCNFKDYDIFVIYLFPEILEKFEDRFINETKPSVKIISNTFQFQKLKYALTQDSIYLYTKQ
ncbi:MAG: hypothetical protein ACP5IC_00335 [Minisyncoccia bacterium]